MRAFLPLHRAFFSSSGLYKVIQSPYLSLLRKLCVRAAIYLSNMLLMVSSLGDLLMGRDTLIFILQNLGFLIDIKKACPEPTSTLEFFGVIVDSVEISFQR